MVAWDTLIYDDGLPFYYFPLGRAGDTALVWFTCPAACSLFGLQYFIYSDYGNARGGVWYAPNYVPGGPEFFPNGGMGSSIVYPFPLDSASDLTPYGGPFDLDTLDFFAGLVWTQNDLPLLMGDAQGNYVPARTQLWRGVWTNIGQITDLMIRAVVIVYGTVGIEEDEENADLTKRFILSQNSPNPVHSRTEIHFVIPQASELILNVYDIQGRLIKNLYQDKANAGEHAIIWDLKDPYGTSVPSGIYLYRLESRDFPSTKKLILLH